MSVTVTLTFSSLAEMRKALLEVPESCAVVGAPAVADGGGGSGPLKTKAPTPGKSQSAAPAVAPDAATTKADAPAGEAPLDYGVLRKAVIAVAALNEPAAMAVLKTFGVPKADQIPEGDRRKALAAFEAKLAELQAVA